MYSKVFMVLAITSMAYSHDVIKDSNNTAETILYDDHLQASPAIWKQTFDVVVDAGEQVISKINITDLRPDKDGDAQIVAGGVGHNNVSITVKSPTIFRGYDFLIQVYSVAESEMDSAKPDIPEKTQTKETSDVTTEPEPTTARNGPTIVTRPTDEVITGASGKPTKEVSDSTGKPTEESFSTGNPTEKVFMSTDKPKTKDLAATFTETSHGMESEVPVEITGKPETKDSAPTFTKTSHGMESEVPFEITGKPETKDLAASFTKTSRVMESQVPVEIQHQ